MKKAQDNLFKHKNASHFYTMKKYIAHYDPVMENQYQTEAN